MLGEAARSVVAALRDLGRIDAPDEGLIAAYLRLAEEIENETKDRAGLFREFRAYDVMVRALGGDGDGDGLANLLDSLAAEMGNDSPPRSPH